MRRIEPLREMWCPIEVNFSFLKKAYWLALTSCIGVSSQQPICQLGSKKDILGLEGTYKVRDGGTLQNLEVQRLEKGVYSFDLRPLERKDRLLTVSFCEVKKRRVAEYRDFEPKTKKLSTKSYWPHFFEEGSQQVRLFFAETSILRLDSHQVPYLILIQDGITKPHAFIALNLSPERNDNLVLSMFRAEVGPSTIIDLKNRFLQSPMLSRR